METLAPERSRPGVESRASSGANLLERVHKGSVRLPSALRSHRSFIRLLRRRVNDGEFMEAMYRLRDSVLRATLAIRRENRGLVIALTGTKGGEGTSLLSLLLSLSLGATRHQKVAFLDGLFDEDRFEVFSRVFGLSREATAAPNGNSPLWGCSSQDQPNTCFLKSDSIQQGFDFFSDKRLVEFLDDLRHTYDFTIIDMPPLLKESGNVFLAPQVDQLYLVAASRATKLADLDRCLEVLAQQDAEVSGVILNRQRRPFWSRWFSKDYFI